MHGNGLKSWLMRIGWICYMLALMLPMFDMATPDGGIHTVGGIDFLITSMMPSWWLVVPMAMPLSVGNVMMVASITFAGITLKRPGRNWWLGPPILFAGMASIYHLHLESFFEEARAGFGFWMLSMLLVSASCFLRGQVDEDAS